MKNKNSNKEYYFMMPIGDWSGDGHSLAKFYLVKSNKNVFDVRKAYFKSVKLNPDLDPATFCDQYQDHGIPEETYQKLIDAGFEDKMKIGKELDWINPDDFAYIVLWFIKLGDSELELSFVGNNQMSWKNESMFQFYGYDKSRKHINGFGYGLFE